MPRSQASIQRRRKTEEQSFVQAAGKQGALRAVVVNPADVETGHWVRWKCQYGCGGFGTSLVCPPHTPDPESTRKMLDGYTRGILFEAPDGEAKRIAAELERELFLSGYYRAFGLGAGPCLLCEECAFDQGCRHPHEARPAMEACGIDVFATVRKHGFEVQVVRDYDAPQHYFGLVLVD